MVVVAIAAFLLLPRGIEKGTLTVNCAECSANVSRTRWQLAAPRWLPLRYTGYGAGAVTEAKSEPCARHTFGYQVRIQSGPSGTYQSGSSATVPTLNGRLVTFATASDVLEFVLSDYHTRFALTAVKIGSSPDGRGGMQIGSDGGD